MRKPQTEAEYWEHFDRRVEAARDRELFNSTNPMGMMKRYLENLVCLCSDEKFGQDAIEWAILSGHVKLTYVLQDDLVLIMGAPGQPDTGRYSQIVEAFQGEVSKGEISENESLLVESYAPLVEEIKKAA